MNLDRFLQESIEEMLGLPVSNETLQLKLRAAEESQRNLQAQVFALDDKFKKAKNEAALNAQALKKSIEQIETLTNELLHLRHHTQKLSDECSLYDKDREVLLDFGNEADERAREAETRAAQVEDELRRKFEENTKLKQELDTLLEMQRTMHKEMEEQRKYAVHLEDNDVQAQRQCSDSEDGLNGITNIEDHLVDQLLESTLNKRMEHSKDLAEGITLKGRSFLESKGREGCHWSLLQMWDKLNPISRHAIALAEKVESLEEEKELICTNLCRAEVEVSKLSEENEKLFQDNEKLRRYLRSSPSTSAKNKRKASSPMGKDSHERVSDLHTTDSSRQPLSPLQFNSQQLV